MAKDRTNTITVRKSILKGRSLVLSFFFFLLVLFLVIYYFSEIKKEVVLLEKVNPYWLAAAILGQLLTYLFTALIYHFLLMPYRLPKHPTLFQLCKASIISLFISQAVPSAGISGNTFLYSFLSRYNMSRAGIFSLILAELLVFYAAMEMVIIFLLVACMLYYTTLYAFKTTLVAGILVYLIFGIAVVFFGRNNPLMRGLMRVINSRFFKFVLKLLHRKLPDQPIVQQEVQLSFLFNRNRSAVVKAFITQLAVIAADAFTLFVLFLGAGYPISAFIVLLTLISTKVVSIIPFLPGALLLYESSMSLFFVTAGVPVAIAVIVTLVYRLLSFWLPIPAGTLLYRSWARNAWR